MPQIKRIFTVYIAVLLILTYGVAAEKIIYTSLVVFKNDTVNENKVLVTYGRPTIYYQSYGEYSLELRGEKEEVLWKQILDISFVKSQFENEFLSDYPLTEEIVVYSIPYAEGTKTLVLMHNEKKIFSKEINPCNLNGVCEGTETHDSCPQDCPITTSDRLCTKEKDGACDPDCFEGVDPDCAKKVDSGILQYLPYAALPLILVIAYAAYRKREEKKIENQRREFEEWKKEQDRLREKSNTAP